MGDWAKDEVGDWKAQNNWSYEVKPEKRSIQEGVYYRHAHGDPQRWTK